MSGVESSFFCASTFAFARSSAVTMRAWPTSDAMKRGVARFLAPWSASALALSRSRAAIEVPLLRGDKQRRVARRVGLADGGARSEEHLRKLDAARLARHVQRRLPVLVGEVGQCAAAQQPTRPGDVLLLARRDELRLSRGVESLVDIGALEGHSFFVTVAEAEVIVTVAAPPP